MNARRRLFLSLLLLVGVPASAAAHSPVEGIGTFYGGMLHPLLVPMHALLLVAVGIWIGQQGIRHIEIGLPGFAGGLVLGLSIAGLGSVTLIPPPLFLVAAFLAGLGIASAWPVPRGAVGVAAVACGFLIGADSAPEFASGRETALGLFGVALGAGFLLIHLLALSEFLQRPWQRIGFRILGSWICAIAIMVLALQFAPERPVAREESASLRGASPTAANSEIATRKTR